MLQFLVKLVEKDQKIDALQNYLLKIIDYSAKGVTHAKYRLQFLVNFVNIDQNIDALQNCLLKIIDLIFMGGTTKIMKIYKFDHLCSI